MTSSILFFKYFNNNNDNIYFYIFYFLNIQYLMIKNTKKISKGFFRTDLQ